MKSQRVGEKTLKSIGNTMRGRTGSIAKTNPQSRFLLSALTLSWQLAICVLVPVFVGSVFDTKYRTGNVGVLVGLVVAIVLSVLVVNRLVKSVSPITPASQKGKD